MINISQDKRSSTNGYDFEIFNVEGDRKCQLKKKKNEKRKLDMETLGTQCTRGASPTL